jgi:ATP-dependent protease ClpP protease subunit
VAAAAQGVQSAAEIFIYGDIGESWWSESVSAKNFVRDLNALDAEHVTIRINSIGGSVPDGIAIHNAIKRHKAQTVTVIDGMALSIASLIALAGDTVEMADNATMMIHAPWTYMAGNSAELREQADVLDTWANAMATSYAAKSGRSQDEMLALLTDGKDHWYTAAEAQEMGLVDSVVTALPLAASAAAAPADLSRFRNVPAALMAARNPSLPAAPQSAPQATSAAAAATTLENPSMTTTVTPAAAPQNPAIVPDAAAIGAQAVAADKARRGEIRAAFAKFGDRAGVSALQAACEEDTACTPEAAGLKLLAHLGKDTTPVAGHISTVMDEADKRRAGIVDALMARAGVATAEQRAAASGSPFRGATLLDVARASLKAAGVKTDGMDKMQIVAAAFTQGTSDFPVLLENTMHKTLQTAYAVQPDTWSRFCARGSVSDFRAHNRYRVGSLGNLETVNELGEFINKAIPDGEKASISAATKGNIINLSRQAIVNDDLQAFVGLANALGRAARRTIEADVYTVLKSNSGLGPVLADGKTLFHADHNNITTGAALSMLAIDADRVAMASQLDVGGNDFLDLRPAVLVVPIGLGGTARTINEAQYDPDTANKLQKPNQVRGLFSDIVDTPRLTGTRRYLFASAAEAPVMEVAFLDGNDTPYLELENGFTVDGARWKVRLDYGIAGIDYRGAVTNAGA